MILLKFKGKKASRRKHVQLLPTGMNNKFSRLALVVREFQNFLQMGLFPIFAYQNFI